MDFVAALQPVEIAGEQPVAMKIEQPTLLGHQEPVILVRVKFGDLAEELVAGVVVDGLGAAGELALVLDEHLLGGRECVRDRMAQVRVLKPLLQPLRLVGHDEVVMAGNAHLDAHHRRRPALGIAGALVDAHPAARQAVIELFQPVDPRADLSSAHAGFSALWNAISSGICMSCSFQVTAAAAAPAVRRTASPSFGFRAGGAGTPLSRRSGDRVDVDLDLRLVGREVDHPEGAVIVPFDLADVAELVPRLDLGDDLGQLHGVFGRNRRRLAGLGLREAGEEQRGTGGEQSNRHGGSFRNAAASAAFRASTNNP